MRTHLRELSFRKADRLSSNGSSVLDPLHVSHSRGLVMLMRSNISVRLRIFPNNEARGLRRLEAVSAGRVGRLSSGGFIGGQFWLFGLDIGCTVARE